MKFLKSFTAVCLASLAIAAPQKQPALNVKIKSVGLTQIKATITNVGDKDLRLLNAGTVLDHGRVEKLIVKSTS